MSSFSIPPSGVPGRLLNTILNGTTNPPGYVGIVGDMWLNTSTYTLFGPKTASGWPNAGQALSGGAGAQGEAGNRFFYGEGPPSQGLGQNTSDLYIDVVNQALYEAE